MEPRREEPKVSKPHPKEKRKRFRIVKLEERVAPKSHGGLSGRSGGGDCSGTLSIE
jgi:hypothetical protein